MSSKNILSLFFLPLLLACLMSPVALAKGVYQKPADFVKQIFVSDIPKPQVLWLSNDDKRIISDIMGRNFNRLRIRYWHKDQDTVWILDEIGKEKPITSGIHVSNHQIAQVKVLAFRESRGDEVRHDFFTRQFKSVTLTPENKLNQHIDGITGATMSVNALTKVARLALWLDKKVQQS